MDRRSGAVQGPQDGLQLDFPTAKLLEYSVRWHELEASVNPFAVATMAHLKTQATRSEPEERRRWKIHLTRSLYEKGYDKEKVVGLFRFVDWIMTLPEDLSRQFKQIVHEIEAEKNMQYVTSIERLAIQDGIQQGRQEGLQEGEARILKRLLNSVFGNLPEELEKRVERASSAEIERWADRVLTCKSLDEVFR